MGDTRLFWNEKMEVPSAIICAYSRSSGYIYLHIPKRLTRECGITSGARFAASVRGEKLIVEQIKEEQCSAGR